VAGAEFNRAAWIHTRGHTSLTVRADHAVLARHLIPVGFFFQARTETAFPNVDPKGAFLRHGSIREVVGIVYYIDFRGGQWEVDGCEPPAAKRTYQ
jgi:hypothetical protein